MSFEELLKKLEDSGLKLLAGIAVLAVGSVIVHFLTKLIFRRDPLKKVDPTARGFLSALIRILLYSVVVIAAIGVMGVPLSSFVAILASAGVAVSLALQGVLSNFIGGIMLLINKQIKADEYVKIGETEGTVRTVSVFYTELITADNRHISVPNSSLTNSAIINYTREGTRRLDIDFGVGYGSDFKAVREALLSILDGENGVLSEPAPQVLLDECGDSALKCKLRLWCRQEEYWRLRFALTEKGRDALNAAGIEIPFPQLDVHMKS